MPRRFSLADLLLALRAAAEPTRLRLLAVCSEGELTVGEMCSVLGQSQPRVSRHLKLLCDAGLVLRFREERCVYYRVPQNGARADSVKQLLAWLDSNDPVIRADRVRCATVRAARAARAAEHLATAGGAAPLESSGDDTTSIRNALLAEIGNASLGDLLDIGTGTGRILRWLAPQARTAVGVDLSSDALRVARTEVHGAGLSHCILQLGDMYELPWAPESFDTITMDDVLREARQPAAVLREAARLLRPGGRLVVIEDYDRLELAPGRDARHPLARLRRWLGEAGVDCERLAPIETGRRHLIIAIARARGPLHAAA